MTEPALLAQARAGDGAAFGTLVDPYRRELHVHCYRLLGSLHDAEDALQETLLAAWRGLAGFEGRASLRTWLYRVATSRCLNATRAAGRRPSTAPRPPVEPPAPTRLGEVAWLEPYPDVLLDELPDTAPDPAATYESREAISLAFVTALQTLPPRQRAVLVLRDVLAFSAADVAGVLDTTPQSVTSALARARGALRDRRADAVPPPPPGSPVEQRVLARLTRALEDGDVPGIVALLTDDVWVRMPPMPMEYQGHEPAGRFLATVAFRPGCRYRLVATRANRQPALGVYLDDPHGAMAHANGLWVLTLAGDRIGVITRFDPGTFPALGLPRRLRP